MRKVTQLFKAIINKMYPVVLSIAIIIVRLYRSLVKVIAHSVIICPTAPPGSLGDEAMIEGCLDYFHSHKYPLVSLITIDDGIMWNQFDGIYENKSITKIKNKFLRYLLFLWAIRKYEQFYVLGADTVDGHYSLAWSLQKIHLAEIAARAGLISNILGFSFNENPSLEVVQEMNVLPDAVRLCVRDPISYKRLINRVSHSATLVADLAFLLNPDGGTRKSKYIQTWITEQRSTGRIIVGINANYENYKTLAGPVTKGSVSKLISYYAETLSCIYEYKNNISLLFIPHDYRMKPENSGDVPLANAICQELQNDIKRYAMVVPMPCRAAEIKYISGQVDIVLSGRMHLAIASLGMGTPVACITYQDKFEGLFEHFKLDKLTITPDNAFNKKLLCDFMILAIDRRHELKRYISTVQPSIKELSLKNFEHLI